MAKHEKFNIEDILNRLPHRFPFIMVDKVLEITEEKIRAVKNVSINEWYFLGHFPDSPVMPGVLIVEGMAQTGAIMMMENFQLPKNVLVYFMTIDKVKFRQMVRPGDQLVYEITLAHGVNDKVRPRGKFIGKAFVDGVLVAEAQMSAMGSVPKEEK